MELKDVKFETVGEAAKAYPQSTLVIRKQFFDGVVARFQDTIKTRTEMLVEEYIERIKELEAENEKLKDAQRWRKFSEEKPECGQKVLFRAKYKTSNIIRTWIGEFRNVDFDVFYASSPGWGCEFLPIEIFGWTPMPSAPKEDK